MTRTEGAKLRRSQLLQVVSDLGSGAGEAMRAIPARVVELAERTRSRCERLPGAMIGALRRRVNVLELATKRDVEAQSKLGRNRVSFVLKEFLEAQHRHDEEFMESLRAELREELQRFAAAFDDDLFAIDAPTPTETRQPLAADLDVAVDVDDEIEVVDYHGIDLSDNGEIDLIDNEVSTRRRAPYETED